MNLFDILTIGQKVFFKFYNDEADAIPTHMHQVGVVIDNVLDFYRVDFGGIVEVIEATKLEAVL